MRKIDKHKDSLMGMATKTINFEKIVLVKLEERAKKADTSVSKLVNLMCRRVALNDQAWVSEMMKYHAMKFQEYKYIKEMSDAKEDPIQVELQLKEKGRLI